MAKKSNYIAGLDIGTTKICCIIGEVIDDEKIDIIGPVSYTHLTLPTTPYV